MCTHSRLFCCCKLYHSCLVLPLQVQLFAETFTEQASYMSLIRADSVEAFEAAKQKLTTGLTVRETGNLLKTYGKAAVACSVAAWDRSHLCVTAVCRP